jgi:hypothetical protein
MVNGETQLIHGANAGIKNKIGLFGGISLCGGRGKWLIGCAL